MSNHFTCLADKRAAILLCSQLQCTYPRFICPQCISKHINHYSNLVPIDLLANEPEQFDMVIQKVFIQLESVLNLQNIKETIKQIEKKAQQIFEQLEQLSIENIRNNVQQNFKKQVQVALQNPHVHSQNNINNFFEEQKKVMQNLATENNTLPQKMIELIEGFKSDTTLLLHSLKVQENSVTSMSQKSCILNQSSIHQMKINNPLDSIIPNKEQDFTIITKNQILSPQREKKIFEFIENDQESSSNDNESEDIPNPLSSSNNSCQKDERNKYQNQNQHINYQFNDSFFFHNHSQQQILALLSQQIQQQYQYQQQQYIKQQQQQLFLLQQQNQQQQQQEERDDNQEEEYFHSCQTIYDSFDNNINNQDLQDKIASVNYSKEKKIIQLNNENQSQININFQTPFHSQFSYFEPLIKVEQEYLDEEKDDILVKKEDGSIEEGQLYCNIQNCSQDNRSDNSKSSRDSNYRNSKEGINSEKQNNRYFKENKYNEEELYEEKEGEDQNTIDQEEEDNINDKEDPEENKIIIKKEENDEQKEIKPKGTISDKQLAENLSEKLKYVIELSTDFQTIIGALKKQQMDLFKRKLKRDSAVIVRVGIDNKNYCGDIFIKVMKWNSNDNEIMQISLQSKESPFHRDYLAIILGMYATLESGIRQIEIQSENKLIIGQMLGNTRVLSVSYIPYFLLANSLKGLFSNIIFTVKKYE